MEDQNQEQQADHPALLVNTNIASSSNMMTNN